MSEYYLKYVIILIFTVSSPAVFAGDLVDTSVVKVHLPAEEFFESYYSDKDFNYGAGSIKPVENRFMQRLQRFIATLKEITVVLPFLIKALFAVIVIIVIYIIISKTKIYRLIYTDSSVPLPDFMESGALQADTDLDMAIRHATEEKNYRMVIRLWYLKVLKELEEKGFIGFKKEKTGFEYCREISDDGIRNEFYDLTGTYYSVWYGKHSHGDDEFVRMLPAFNSFYSKIHVAKE